MRFLIILSFFIFFEIFANKITVSSYQLNSVYNYQYESSVEIQSSTISDLSEAAHTNPIAKLKFSVQPIEFSGSNILFAKLKITSVDSNLVNLGETFSACTSESLKKNEAGFELDVNSQKVLTVYFTDQDSESSILIKRSIIELFDVNHLEETQESIIGNCKINSTLSYEFDAATLNKSKYDCRQTYKFSNDFQRNQQVLNAQIDRSINMKYTFQKSQNNNTSLAVISSGSSLDFLKIFSELYPKSYQKVLSRQSLTLIDVKQRTIKEKGLGEFQIKTSLVYNPSNKDKLIKNLFELKNAEKKFQTVLNRLKKPKIPLMTPTMTSNYLLLIQIVREGFQTSGEEFLTKILLANQNSPQIMKFLVQVILNAQTKPSMNALKSILDISSWSQVNGVSQQTVNVIEDLIVSSQLLTKSSNEFLKIIMEIHDNHQTIPIPEIEARSILAVGSLLSLGTENYSEETYKKALNKITNKLFDFNKDYPVYMEALKNSNHHECFQTLVKTIKSTSSSKLTLAALQYIGQNIQRKQIGVPDDLFEQFLKIFYNDDKKYTEEVRLEALWIIVNTYMDLLESNDSPILENIIRTLFDSKLNTTKEFLFFCQQLLLTKKHQNAQFKNVLDRVISSPYSKTNNFNFYSMHGKSAAKSSTLFETMGIRLMNNYKQLQSDDGSIRMLDYSVNFQDHANNNIDILKFEMYAKHLNGLTSSAPVTEESNDEYDSGSEAAINLHLSLMNQKLRMHELFNGYSSMISTIWSLPTRMTRIFSINFITNDQTQNIILQNGLVLNVKTLGAIGLDIRGFSDFSLWSQYFKMIMKKSAAMQIVQKISLINDLKVSAQSQIVLKGDSVIDARITNDFGSVPSQTCSKISNRRVYFKENLMISTLKKNKLIPIKKLGRHTIIQPSTFAISREATASC